MHKLLEEKQTISNESGPLVKKETGKNTGDEASLETSAPPIAAKNNSALKKHWGGRTFRFSLNSFRPGGNISLRRFSIIEAAFLLIMAYLASRGLGVIRQSIFNALFGTGPEANAFYVCWVCLVCLFNLIAGGALSHAFIPVFLSYEKDHDQREAWRLMSLVFNLMLVNQPPNTPNTEFLTPAFVQNILVPGPSFSPAEKALTTDLTRIMLIQPLILGLGTIVTSVLNSKRQFLLPALSIAVYNFVCWVCLVVLLAIPGVGIYGPTYGVLAAAACQVIVMIPGLMRQGVRYTFIWDLSHPGLREVARLLVPNALAVVVASVGYIIDTTFSSYLPDPASLAALHNSQLLFALPLALVAQAIGQAVLPQMAVQAAFGRYVRLFQTALKIIGGSILLSVPCAILLWLLGKPTIRLLFQHGAFTAHSSTITNLALIGYAVGLPAFIAGDLLSRGFIALKDARTPLFTNTLSLVARIGLTIFLLGILTGDKIILAIPLATSGSATIESILLGLLLFLRLRSKVKNDKGMQRLLQRRKNKQLMKRKTKQLEIDPDAVVQNKEEVL